MLPTRRGEFSVQGFPRRDGGGLRATIEPVIEQLLANRLAKG